MLDYSALLYDPVYAEIGVEATFMTNLLDVVLTVIDDTRPKILPAGSAEVRSVGPGAFVRIPELEENGIGRDDWMNASLSFNGRSWTVRSYELRGSPNGEDSGEVWFLLKAVASVVPPPDTPAWVPANAKIHIDFLGGSPQGRAWSNGAVVAIDTLLGSDPNTENAWGPTGYDPADLTADGLKYSTSPPALIGAALTKVLAGATVRFVVKVGLPVITSSFVLVSSDGADAIDIDNIDIDMHAYSWNGTANADLNGIINNLNGAINATAVTVTATRLEAVANGYTTPIALTLSDADRPVANPLTAAIMDAFSQILQSITIYDPLPDTTGLSELSALDTARASP